MLSTDEIVEEYRSFAGTKRRFLGNPNSDCPYICSIGVDEKHTDRNGDNWYIITVFTNSIDRWLSNQCETNYEYCGHACPHPKWDRYPRYNIHESLLFYIQLKWT